MVTTDQRFRTDVYNIKQEEPEGKPTKPTKIKKTETQGQGSNGNTELTRKQKIKWL